MPNIDTSKVKTIASEMIDINNRYKDDFSAVEQAINRLRNDWQQPQNVSTAAFACFEEIKSKYFDSAIKERQELALYLCDAVGIGYEEAENTNKRLLEDLFDVACTVSSIVGVVNNNNQDVKNNKYLKSFSENKDYSTIIGYSDSYRYNQNHYDELFKRNGTNYGCAHTAEAMAYSMYNNIKITPDNAEMIKYGSNLNNAWNCSNNITEVTTMTAKEKYQIIYDYISKGQPVVLAVGSGNHWVTAVGIRNATSRENIQPSDILIVNPTDGQTYSLEHYSNNKSGNHYKVNDCDGCYMRIPKSQ